MKINDASSLDQAAGIIALKFGCHKLQVNSAFAAELPDSYSHYEYMDDEIWTSGILGSLSLIVSGLRSHEE